MSCWTAWPSVPGTVAIRACSTTRRSTAGTPVPTRAGSTPAIRVQRVHVPGRHGLQPGQHQPDEVPPARTASFDVERFQAACRLFFIAQEILVDHASYPTERDCREQPSLPSAGLGLLEPGQPAHDQRSAVRLGRGARLVRSDHRVAAWRGESDQRRTGRRRSVRSMATPRIASRCCA